MDSVQRELSDQIDQATQRLLDRARVITEPDLRAPSLLPGWTRARVLAHVARTRPRAAIVVTDGYIEPLTPAQVAATACEPMPNTRCM